jgi:small-conductance mechanosensitive channel
MDVKAINAAIIQGEFTYEQLNTIGNAVRYARSQLAKSVKSLLAVGDNVNFTSGKTGRNYTGSVTKIAIKYVTVRTVDGLWKVPAAMLTRVAHEREYA